MNKWWSSSLSGLLLCFAFAGGVRAQSVEGVDLPTYDTRYYVIHTDLTGDALREAKLRMTKMAEEYRARTRGFFGSADQKLPFYLFRKAKDYYATGVPENSVGVFVGGTALLALAGDKTDLQTWHTIQHEGFHQYVYSVIGSNLPIWLNEGLAEYFGEGLFTGDAFVTGLIPRWRLERVKKTLKAGDFVPLRSMMSLPTEEWNARLSVHDYDQAWAMVQFLAHADDGRYQRAFGAFIADVGRGKQWQIAWRDHLGDIEAFEARWKAYWTELPDDPTAALYAKVAAEILTSFLGRAHAQGQHFDSYADFAKALLDEKVRCSPDDWLPPSLGRDGAMLARTVGTWSLEPGLRGRPPRLVLQMKDGTRVFGTFTLGRDATVTRVAADVVAPRRPRNTTTTTTPRPVGH